MVGQAAIVGGGVDARGQCVGIVGCVGGDDARRRSQQFVHVRAGRDDRATSGGDPGGDRAGRGDRLVRSDRDVDGGEVAVEIGLLEPAGHGAPNTDALPVDHQLIDEIGVAGRGTAQRKQVDVCSSACTRFEDRHVALARIQEAENPHCCERCGADRLDLRRRPALDEMRDHDHRTVEAAST